MPSPHPWHLDFYWLWAVPLLWPAAVVVVVAASVAAAISAAAAAVASVVEILVVAVVAVLIASAPRASNRPRWSVQPRSNVLPLSHREAADFTVVGFMAVAVAVAQPELIGPKIARLIRATAAAIRCMATALAAPGRVTTSQLISSGA